MTETIRTTKRRNARSIRTRVRTTASAGRLRLVISRSGRQIYAQVVDKEGKTMASASSLKIKAGNKLEMAKQVGEMVAKTALDKNISEVSLDRKHYKYHGRVKALAEGARAAGLKF